MSDTTSPVEVNLPRTRGRFTTAFLCFGILLLIGSHVELRWRSAEKKEASFDETWEEIMSDLTDENISRDDILRIVADYTEIGYSKTTTTSSKSILRRRQKPSPQPTAAPSGTATQTYTPATRKRWPASTSSSKRTRRSAIPRSGSCTTTWIRGPSLALCTGQPSRQRTRCG